MTYEQYVADKIRAARIEAGISGQEKLAREMGVTLGAVSLWERAKALPTMPNLQKIAAVTRKPLEFFFPDQKTMEKLTKLCNALVLNRVA